MPTVIVVSELTPRSCLRF